MIRPGITDSRLAMITATRLAGTFGHSIRLKAGAVSCRARMGVVWSTDPSLDAAGLVAMAHAAMDEAKRKGGNRSILYDQHTAGSGHAD